jgi:hypothetical protein
MRGAALESKSLSWRDLAAVRPHCKAVAAYNLHTTSVWRGHGPPTCYMPSPAGRGFMACATVPPARHALPAAPLPAARICVAGASIVCTRTTSQAVAIEDCLLGLQGSEQHGAADANVGEWPRAPAGKHRLLSRAAKGPAVRAASRWWAMVCAGNAVPCGLAGLKAMCRTCYRRGIACSDCLQRMKLRRNCERQRRPEALRPSSRWAGPSDGEE